MLLSQQVSLNGESVSPRRTRISWLAGRVGARARIRAWVWALQARQESNESVKTHCPVLKALPAPSPQCPKRGRAGKGHYLFLEQAWWTR